MAAYKYPSVISMSEKRLRKDASALADELLRGSTGFIEEAAFEAEAITINQRCKCGATYVADGGLLLGYKVSSNRDAKLVWNKVAKLPVGRKVNRIRVMEQALESCFLCVEVEKE